MKPSTESGVPFEDASVASDASAVASGVPVATSAPGCTHELGGSSVLTMHTIPRGQIVNVVHSILPPPKSLHSMSAAT